MRFLVLDVMVLNQHTSNVFLWKQYLYYFYKKKYFCLLYIKIGEFVNRSNPCTYFDQIQPLRWVHYDYWMGFFCMYIYIYKKGLTIPKGLYEAFISRTVNTIDNTTLHRKQNLWSTKNTHNQNELVCFGKVSSFSTPLVASVVLLLLNIR
jgi:hypothetical protein